MLASFQIKDKLKKTRFLQEIFLMADISIEVILSMLFLILNNVNILFTEQELIQRLYTLSNILPTSKQGQIIDQKKFAIAALDLSKEGSVIYIVFLNLNLKILINQAQKAQIASHLAKKFTVPVKYLDLANIFSKKLVAELPKHYNINKYWINLKLDKQPLFDLIYSLGPVELKTLKTYNQTNLANAFI